MRNNLKKRKSETLSYQKKNSQTQGQQGSHRHIEVLRIQWRTVREQASLWQEDQRDQVIDSKDFFHAKWEPFEGLMIEAVL